MAKTLYTAAATVTGGRLTGHGRTSDGALDVAIRIPAELGGEGGGTNPEQLFAVGFGSCFESALTTVARRMKVEADDVSVDVRVHLQAGEDRRFVVAVEMDVTLPHLDVAQAQELVAAAHAVCPYSNATRGNIDIAFTANGADVELA